jgi:hypothetical protein
MNISRVGVDLALPHEYSIRGVSRRVTVTRIDRLARSTFDMFAIAPANAGTKHNPRGSVRGEERLLSDMTSTGFMACAGMSIMPN